jgi:hypothetical protein
MVKGKTILGSLISDALRTPEVGTSMCHGLCGQGSISGGDEIFPFTTASRRAVRPTQPPI